jgi:hypothetical protein
VIGAAVKAMRIATGEEPEDFGADDSKDKAAQSLWAARRESARNEPQQQRKTEIAKKAAEARWRRR